MSVEPIKSAAQEKIKKKHNWMRSFVISPPLDDLDKAQLESRGKVLNDFKRNIYRR